MTYFPDVNVWIAMSSPGHLHYQAATHWFEGAMRDRIAFCRVTQMGYLRLLTNRHVTDSNVLTPVRAWQAFDDLSRVTRIFFADEPIDLREWRTIMHQPGSGLNTWTDAYLSGFAIGSGFTLVSFDSAFRKHRRLSSLILK